MSEYHGDIELGDTIQWLFTTVDATGLPTVLTGTPTATAYTDGGVTQSATGVTLTADFDGVVGLNLMSIVATSGNGFAAGENIEIVLDAGTVDGVSVVGYAVGGFSINRAPNGRPKKNVALSNIPFVMVDETDGLTLETGLTIAGQRSIDGALTWTNVTGTFTEVDNGAYHFDATAADMNGDTIIFKFTATGAAASFVSFITRP